MPAKDALPRVSDQAVEKATGKTWSQWFKRLDAAGAAKLDHKGIVAWLRDNHPDVSAWWTQSLAVGYEQARGLRAKHEKPAGFEISASKTIGVPLERLYAAWQNASVRKRWLSLERIVIHKATPLKSLRITWTDGQKSVQVQFTAKGDTKSQVAVQHGKLEDAAAAERQKAFWTEKLEALRKLLEKQTVTGT